MTKIRVHFGETLGALVGYHPLEEAKRAKTLIDAIKEGVYSDEFIDVKTHSLDYIAMIRYYSETVWGKQKASEHVEFFVDGKSVGFEINDVFTDGNKAIDFIRENTPEDE